MVTETLSIKISKSDKNLLRQCARRHRSSASALLRDALRNVLQSPQASQASRSRSMATCWKSWIAVGVIFRGTRLA